MRHAGPIILIALLPVAGWPCSFVPSQAPIEEQWRNAYCSSDLAIIGIAREVIPIDVSMVKVEISPIWGFKGLREGRNVNTSYVFNANTERSSCGMPFERGELYLILARALEAPGEIEPSWYTLPLNKAADLREYLESLPEDRDICEAGDSEEPPRYLLPTIWREELLREIQNDTDP